MPEVTVDTNVKEPQPLPESDPVSRRPRFAESHGLVSAMAFIVFAIVAAVLVPQVVSDPYQLRLAVNSAGIGILALSVGFLVRQLGLVSFGHAAYFGGSGYLIAIVLDHTSVSTLVAVLVAVAGSTVIASIAGALIVRLSGITFAMLTLAIGQALFIVATKWRTVTGGFDGTPVSTRGSLFGLSSIDLSNGAKSWYFAWTCLALMIGMLWLVARSRFGRVLLTIRENEERARFCGVRTYWYRLATFTLSGFVAGVGGAVYALHQGFVSPDLLFWTNSGNALVMSVIGGTGSLAGGPVGAFAYSFAQDATSSVTDRWQLIVGLAFIVVVVAFPAGIAGIGRLVKPLALRVWSRRDHS